MATSEKLKSLSKQWKTAEPIEAGFANVPDNDYIMQITEMVLGDSKKGNVQVVTTLKIVDGDQEGTEIKMFDGLESNENSMGYFKNKCAVIGLELPDDLNEWADAFEQFINDNVDLYNVTAKTKGEYQNYYIRGISEFKLEGDEAPPEPPKKETKLASKGKLKKK